ncbi:MAG: DNA-processing protein DprA [Ruminococcus sp.]|nr:DNA-processing protein DprA [Ruminococcus sp.]MCM1381234.1 DNA-processing protein DprA [Muribaculaceae bacterium]
MDRENVFQWLWITNCLGCGNKRIWEVVSQFPTVSEAYGALNGGEARKSLLTDRERKSADGITEEQIEELISYCEKGNIYILTYDDGKYPERLKSIFNPPAVLFCRGDISCLENDFSISIVGTRRPSDYSVRLTNALGKELSKFGVVIISGFAVGIDIAANMSAVNSGGKTIAVLGCGIDRDYPKENSAYRNAIEKNGLFISEYYPKTGGSPVSFPARNRILSGLSLGTVVIEAAEKSGALITANLALSQGKDIFAAAPHDLFDKRYGGNVRLIRDGAVCLCGLRDILYEYYENYGHKIASAADELFARVPKGTVLDALEKPVKTAENNRTVRTEKVTEKAAETVSEYDPSELTEEELTVYNALKKAGTAMLADDIAEICGIDISETLTILTDLEIEGAVTQRAGQKYIAN